MPISGAHTAIVGFDFAAKSERSVELAAAREAMLAGEFLWIDVDLYDPKAAELGLEDLGLFHPSQLEDMLEGAITTGVARYDDQVHLILTACRLDGGLIETRVDVIITDGCLLTMHRGRVGFIDAIRRGYREDFLHHARTPNFLVYEIWDHLLESYLTVQGQFEDRVESVQARLLQAVEDEFFAEVSMLGANLLRFRKVLLPTRAVLSEISTRKSRFVADETQRYLGNMVGTLETILQDVMVDRGILSDSLNLHMSIIGHRTNRVMSRLTVVSVIFMPLTFLVGVYGMNFEHIPEFKWTYGYAYFWGVTFVTVLGLLALLRRKRIL